MKGNVLKQIAKNISQIMSSNEKISSKELSKRSGINYSTLSPLLRGEREFAVTKLVDLAVALNVTPDAILKGTFKEPTNMLFEDKKITPDYLAAFITGAELSRFHVFDIKNNNSKTQFLPFAICHCLHNQSNHHN